MTSLKQIEANRRNAQKSTGPNTQGGKQRSRYNALRHGLTAETVVGALERADDYTDFETAIIAEYSPQSIVEHELAARLASLLWRLRRATVIETGLFEMQADPLARFRQARNSTSNSDTVVELNGETNCVNSDAGSVSPRNVTSQSNGFAFETIRYSKRETSNFAQSFLRLASLPNFAFDRLSRYEAYLWRQADQIMFLLNNRK